jgi:hypothetical protein
MKKILLFFTIFIPLMIAAETVVPPGPVSGHWKLNYSPYVITGDIFIEEGNTLVIYPGVELLFKGAYKLEVFGALEAKGLETSKIRFTTYDGIDIWNGIRILESNSNSIIDHCIIEWAFADLQFDPHNYLKSCGGGVLCYNVTESTINISNTIIQDCRAVYGGGIASYNSNVIIENCEITDNIAAYGGGIFLYENAQTVIKHSSIFRNQATFTGGGIALENTTNVTMQRTHVAFNNAALGGGMHFHYSFGDFCGNNIVDNSADEDGGGIYFSEGSSPEFTNTVIYTNSDGTKGSGNQIYLKDNSDPDFRYCNIYGGLEGFEGPGVVYYTGEYEFCVDGDPMFKDADAGDFTITWGNYPYDDDTKSACIDMGCPDHPSDPDQSCCDIGVFSYFQLLNKPVELYGEVLTNTTILTGWNSCYGALGYMVDVAWDHGFNNYIVKDWRVLEPETELEVYLPHPTELVYFRVRSFNTGLTSEYSDEYVVLMVSLDEPEDENVQIYSSATGIHINTTRSYTYPGNVWIYNISGQLLGHYSMKPGTNTIDPGVTSQVVIVKVILDGEVYQQKLLMR